LERPQPGPGRPRGDSESVNPNGGLPARRAMSRWAWRLFRREWRQQVMILALLVVSVGAIVLGSGIATNDPLPANDGFGTAQDMATLGPSPKVAGEVAKLHARFGTVEVIENETVTIPGTIKTFQLRAQSSHGPYSQPMLSLLSGRYPAADGEVAVTPDLESQFNISVGSSWHVAATTFKVVGVVQNPESLLDSFALVIPGQVTHPDQTTVLFDANGVAPASIGPNVATPGLLANHNPLNPKTIVLALATLCMLLIGLVSIGGFMVIAQRRLRSIGMVGALGATDKHIRLVVRVNGLVTGIVGSVVGLGVGLVAWLAYRPRLEQSAHHVFEMFALPWDVILPGMALAVVATYLSAVRPARSITQVPIVAALAGRPAPPKKVHRSAIPGLVFGGIAFLLFSASGLSAGNGGGQAQIVGGFITLIIAVVLLTPFCVSAVALVGRRAPIAMRLALRDLGRYRARSGPALAAISLGILIATVIAVVSSARYGNVLDYAGQNLASNQLVLYTPTYGGPTPPGPGGPSVNPSTAQMTSTADAMASSIGAGSPIPLYSTSANLNYFASGRNWNGPIFVGTPQVLAAFGIRQSQIDPTALLLSSRPGLDGYSRPGSNLGLEYDNTPSKGTGSQGGPSQPQSCSPSNPCPQPGQNSISRCGPGSCIPSPLIQEVSALPTGTSAPNTVLTEYAVTHLHLQSSFSLAGWLMVAPHALTATQIHNSEQVAANANMYVETKNDAPSAAEVENWATAFGVLLALAILAMTVGLIRSESASDLRTLAATGAGSPTRRALTATTAGTLALVGAVLGVVAGYVASAAWFSGNSLNGGIGALSAVPWPSLFVMLVAMPAVAVAAGFVFAGRDQRMAHQPLD
ncbi:MAG TPA: FtsX-like permease family protein, partial [Acidimicrobiales bacterium]|nr:FtsX-like permease family protein [Acidimicrobiales bacterium]